MRQSTRSSPRIANITSTWSRNISIILSGVITATGLLKRPRLTSSAGRSEKENRSGSHGCCALATLRLLHPFMPQLTQEIWSLLGLGKGSIQFAAPPEKLALDAVANVADSRRLVSRIYETVQAGRNLRSASKVAVKPKDTIYLRTNDKRFPSKLLP